jgi:hypothetical protein
MEISSPPLEEEKDPKKIYEEEKVDLPDLPDVVDIGQVRQEDRLRVMRRYAILSNLAYEYYDKPFEVAEKNMKKYLPNHEILPEFSDSNSVVVKKNNDVIISYRGTNPTNISDLVADVKIATGFPLTGRFDEAQKKYEAVRATYPDADITTTGHSLGGALGYSVAKNNQLDGHFFNMGSSIINPSDLIDTFSSDTSKPVNTYHTFGDIVSVSKKYMDTRDNFLQVPRPNWLKDTLKNFALYGLGGGALKTEFMDIHGLHNFLPPQEFEGDLEPDDIGYRWVKPLIDYMERQTKVSNRGNPVEFDRARTICMKKYQNPFRKCN